jgi:hypothetical protein
MERIYEWTDESRSLQLYRGKILLVKHPEEQINFNQRQRARTLWRRNGLNCITADGKSFAVAHNPGEKKTSWRLRQKKSLYLCMIEHQHQQRELPQDAIWLCFSPAVPHGKVGAKQGYVVMLSIRTADECFIYASDCQLLNRQAVAWIMAQRPDTVVTSGPAFYHPQLPDSLKQAGKRNLVRLARAVKHLIVDHHLCRELEFNKHLIGALSTAAQKGHQLLVAAQLRGTAPRPLEAMRAQLHHQKPVPAQWYCRFEESTWEERRQMLACSL